MAKATYYRRSRSTNRNLKRQAGVGLIEVLVALLISAFALLGLAGLQASSLRYQKTANFRALATQFSNELSDRMRANLRGARDGSYNLATSGYTVNAPAVPSTTPCDGTTPASCTPAAVASTDIYNWRKSLHDGISGGWGEVSGDTTNGFVIRVYFKEPSKQNLSEVADPKCRSAALGADDKDVRCFVTVFYP